MGGGGFSMEPENPLLDVRSHVRAGDARDGPPARVLRADRQLFPRAVEDLEAFVLAQDVIYVGGGNTANLLAVWRVHGLDRIFRTAWEQGVVLTGLSAGMNCWFAESVTDSYGAHALRELHDGLALLPESACPHYDGEGQRRPTFRRLVGEQVLGNGWAADDGAALVFDGGRLAEVVASRPAATGYRVECTPSGDVHEQRPHPLPRDLTAHARRNRGT